MANSLVRLPIPYVGDFNKGRPLFNAKLFIGEPDLDPEIPANQKTVTGRQEDGALVTMAQPVRTSSGGYPIYNNAPIELLVDGAYSLKVLDKNDNQTYYFANVEDGKPVTFDDKPVLYRDTVAEAKADVDLTVGMYVTTKGYSSPNDGGGANYIVVAGGTGTDDGGSYHDMANGNQLELICGSVVNVLVFGADNTNDQSSDSHTAFTNALAFRDHVYAPSGVYYISDTISLGQGQTLEGDGFDFWDTFRQSRILKSIDHGTHLLFKGNGAKNFSCINLPNVQTAKTISTDTFNFTDFTNNDSVNGNPATAKPFSVAILMAEDSQLKNLRLIPNFDGINGYLNTSAQTIGDQWDVGIWCQSANEAVIENVQCVGYWLKAGVLVTENDGTYEQVANPERLRVSQLTTQGIRGLLIRNSPQWEVFSNTNTTINVQYNQSWTLTSQNKFRILGSTTIFTFTGYSLISPTEIQLTGVTPNLPAGVSILRSPSQGNNLNGTIFNDTYCAAFEHSSGTAAQNLLSLGLPIAGCFEIDGFPLRGLKFKNTKFQSVYDSLNSLLGDCRDMQWVQCQTEGGALIAYNTAQSPVAMTENMRVYSSQLDPHDKTEFTPRELYDDDVMFPTQFTDGITRFRPSLDEKNIQIEDFTGQALWQASFADKNINAFNYDGDNLYRHNGVTKGTNVYGEGYAIRRQSDNAAFLEFFSGSGNGASLANITAGGELVSTSITRPLTDNSVSCGNISFRWTDIFAVSGSVNTSDEREKTEILDITDNILDAWSSVGFKSYKWIDAVNKKGEEARRHFGLLAQDIIRAFEAKGLDATNYGIVCYDEWDDTYDDQGNLVIEAGNRWGIRPDQCLFLESALLRRELNKIKS